MVKNRPASSFSRKQGNREPKKLILVVVEGEETEFNYFNAFRKNNRLQTLSLEVEPSNKSAPVHVVEYANTLYKQKEKDSKKGNGLQYDEVFCVVDGDTDLNNYTTAIERAKKYNFHFIYSIPCFEFWFLLHFNCSTHPYNTCGSLIKELRKYIPNYEKNIDIFNLLNSNCSTAITNSRKMCQFQSETCTDLRPNPITMVHLLVEKLFLL